MKSKKYICILILILAFTLVFPRLPVFAEVKQINIYINNKLLAIPASYGKSLSLDGRAFVPLRVITEKLGVKVDWIQKEKAIIINGNIKVKVDSHIAETPSGNVEMDVKVFSNSDGRIYVPITFISEILGFDVRWERNGNALDVRINSNITDIITNPGDTIVIDVSNLSAPWYDTGYANIDAFRGKIGFNKSSTVGTRPTGSSLEEDIAHFNNTMLKNTNTNFADGGTLDFMGKGMDTLNDWWVKTIRDPKTKNPVIVLRGWAHHEGEYGNFRTMTTMNATAEMIRYYSKSTKDAEAIWKFIDDAAMNEKKICSTKPYLFGNTKVLILDPSTLGVDIHFIESN